MRTVSTFALLIVAAAVALVAAGPRASYAGPGSTLARPFDPVLITGADVPSLAGIAPGDLVAFRYAGSWQQLPVQVDERDMIEFADVYNHNPNSGSGIFQLQYTDAGTFTGPDSDATLDANDEIVFMAKDAGGAAPPSAGQPAGTVVGSGVRLAITDSLDPGATGYVYLFESPSLDPSAGQLYVSYTFNLLSGSYLGTYQTADGPNPENSVAVSAYYGHHFSDRWVSDEIEITAGAATGVDILDRHKNLFAPGDCFRSENTFIDAEGAFVVNTSGPVRALRSYIGANSGPLTQREHVFYAQREDIRTFLRVHPIGSMMDFFDYVGPAASGMVYRNNLNTAGVTIDGSPDSPAAGAITWESVTGAQGSLVMATSFDTNIAGFAYTSYYLDDSTPPVTQCTGDGEAFGSSGLYINQPIPCTDPQGACTNYLRQTRTIYYEEPGETAAEAAALAANAQKPLSVSVTPLSTAVGGLTELARPAGVAASGRGLGMTLVGLAVAGCALAAGAALWRRRRAVRSV